MSERTDMKNKIPDYKLQDYSLVHKSKKWLNHFGETLRYLLNKSLTSKNSTVSLDDDWNKLEPNTISQVDSWSGPHAPHLYGKGVVITLSNDDGYKDYQVAIGEGKLASRLIGGPWSYTNGDDRKQITSLSSQITGIADQSRHLKSSISADTSKLCSYIDDNTNLADSLSYEDISLSQSASAKASSASNEGSSLNSVKEDKTSESADVKRINQILATKENIIDGNIMDPDLNHDLKVGNFLIDKSVELRHDPHTTFKHHDIGFLQVRHVGNQDLLQILYLALGNPNNKIGSNTNLDGSGSISYRFIYHHKPLLFQHWHTIPYQSSLNRFKREVSSSFATNNSSISSYVDSINDDISINSTDENILISNTADNLKSYTDSEFAVAGSMTDRNYSNANSKETTDFDSLTNQFNSLTSSARSETAVETSIEASNLMNSFSSNSDSMNMSLQNAILNIQNFESTVVATNTNTADQLSNVSNSANYNYQNLSNANVQLSKQISPAINSAINKNNIPLHNAWNSSISSNNLIVNQKIASQNNDMLSRANSYTSSASSTNSEYTTQEIGSIDMRLYGISSNMSGVDAKFIGNLSNALTSLSTHTSNNSNYAKADFNQAEADLTSLEHRVTNDESILDSFLSNLNTSLTSEFDKYTK